MELDEKYNHDESNYGESIVYFRKNPNIPDEDGPISIGTWFLWVILSCKR